MIEVAHAFEVLVSSVADRMIEAGFKRSGSKYTRKSTECRFELLFVKGRSSSDAALEASLRAEVYVTKFDKLYRKNPWEKRIPTASPYDFAKNQHQLDESGGRHHWVIRDEAGLVHAAAEAGELAGVALRYFGEFNDVRRVEAALRLEMERAGMDIVADQIRYPLFLLLSGKASESEAAFELVKARLGEDQKSMRSLEKF
jgi:hypothetical protein